jgi:hypothetical protein
MEGNSAHKNQNKYDDSEGVDIQLSAQETPHCPSTAVQTPADGQAVDFAQADISTAPDERDSMAVFVTRHASSPTVILKQYGYSGRESSQGNNSLPETLPKKDEQNQNDLRVVGRGRESAQVQGNILIDKLIRKIIDQTKQEDYNSYHGKSDRIEGPRKEINNGSI